MPTISSAFAPFIPLTSHFGVVRGRKGKDHHLSMSTLEPSRTKKLTTKKQRKLVKKSENGCRVANKVTVTVRNAGKSSAYTTEKNKYMKAFKPLKDLVLRSKVSGKVVDVCDFGAFVNIGYATRGSRAGTALLHISQIQDDRIENIHDFVKVGDVIEGARVISVNLEKGEVGLSLRACYPKCRDITTLKVGDELEGKVDSVVPYGVFVDVGANVNALLHISRITGGAIENIRHHLNEGDAVLVRVIYINKEKETMAVSMLDETADQYLDCRMSQRIKRFCYCWDLSRGF